MQRIQLRSSNAGRTGKPMCPKTLKVTWSVADGDAPNAQNCCEKRPRSTAADLSSRPLPNHCSSRSNSVVFTRRSRAVESRALNSCVNHSREGGREDCYWSLKSHGTDKCKTDCCSGDDRCVYMDEPPSAGLRTCTGTSMGRRSSVRKMLPTSCLLVRAATSASFSSSALSAGQRATTIRTSHRSIFEPTASVGPCWMSTWPARMTSAFPTPGGHRLF